MKLYEYAIIYVPEDADGNIVRADCKVLSGPSTLLAADEKSVTLKAAKEIPEDVELDYVQVLVRPF